MARKKDYLDAVAITGFFIMFGPFIFQVLLSIFTGSGIPTNIKTEDHGLVTYIGGFFFFTGLQMLLYVFGMRIWTNRKEQ